MGNDGDSFVDEKEDPDAADDFKVTYDDQDDEPDGEVPVDAPVDEGGGDEAGHKKRLVGEGVENSSGERLLVEMAGNPAVQSIKDRGKGVNRDGEPAEGFVGRFGVDRASIAHGNPGKHRDEGKTNEGDDGGKSHGEVSF